MIDPRHAAIMLEHGQRDDAPLVGDDVATRIVNGLFADLRDRRFLKWMFGPPGSSTKVTSDVDRIDDETQIKIAEQWREIIRQALAD